MPRLLEMILVGAKLITRADGGTLYTVNDDKKLSFEIVRTTSLGIAMGGTSNRRVQFKAISLYHRDGRPNNERVVAYSALNNATVNLPDVYDDQGTEFDFTGPRMFDQRMNYRTRSMLSVPMINHDGKTIGVIQLINKQDKQNSAVMEFDNNDVHLVKSLASQAAIALTNKRLVDDLKELFDSFIKTIATGIDEKSPYTGGHCRRVPELTLALAEAASRDNNRMKAFTLTNQKRYTLEVASWLHDCGKLSTPVHVVDKATKLETIHDRIHLIDTRFEVLKRDAEITKLTKLLESGSDNPEAEAIEKCYTEEIQALNEERDFIRHCNAGVESMAHELKDRVKKIATRTWRNCEGQVAPFFSEDELNNLLIHYGTLNAEERKIVNDHIVVTNKMLESMKFPENMKEVPEYAGGHHERMDGTGYPQGLTREQMSVPARVMAIADVFEALTAEDRPYKDGKKLSEALSILGRMKLQNHIDPDLFDIFIHEKVYLPYAREYMDPKLIDIEEPFEIPGYPFKMP
ncbi:HD-GYP domain, c-di-GMP phosphodiesterase class II (or its inactivated variant) [Mariprofundus aestuarium]|uniref:HD-GYP domain, c-di-GMP phosphodiesterase class II (Or its inactivated variant) n=1 Tax=Mariprofundus aestuarium TaxID=1921086 RepID=A0A2K8KYD9_MARES|nr:HD family phosphohydrolase [Mariprofundus aestuarium]ATX80020.1 HD-GYP domain, c-di-GMP phosphodiesterase class II (or its inactivated variant) [Mariprofundus aestuarium]